jgi:hypothetical protein
MTATAQDAPPHLAYTSLFCLAFRCRAGFGEQVLLIISECRLSFYAKFKFTLKYIVQWRRLVTIGKRSAHKSDTIIRHRRRFKRGRNRSLRFAAKLSGRMNLNFRFRIESELLEETNPDITAGILAEVFEEGVGTVKRSREVDIK